MKIPTNFDPDKTWFTSDLHLFHKNIIHLCSRPFSDMEAMNAALIHSWNERVQPGDDVFVLGDFSFGSQQKTYEALRSMTGKKHLIFGNHDADLRKHPDTLSANFGITGDIIEATVGNRAVVMCHYPIESWPGMHRGVIHLHGHSHGKSRVRKNRLDVGVDSAGYRPLSWSEALSRLPSETFEGARHEI